MFSWIQKPIPLEKREILDFVFWIILILLVGVMVFVYLTVPFLVLIPLALVIIDLRLLFINQKIALKEIRAKKENTIKPTKTFKY